MMTENSVRFKLLVFTFFLKPKCGTSFLNASGLNFFFDGGCLCRLFVFVYQYVRRIGVSNCTTHGVAENQGSAGRL